ncbi:MAG: PEP-CTERM sorting domain-containing protein [Candidatus Brocadiia bacterium]
MRAKMLLDKKLVAYSAAVGAVFAAGGSAQATIEYFTTPGGWTGTGDNQYLLSFDLAGNVMTNPSAPGPNDQFAIKNARNSSINAMVIRGVQPGAAIEGIDAKALPVPASHNMGPSATVYRSLFMGVNLVSAGGTRSFGDWAPGTRAYLGLQFDDAGTPLYGWADLQMNAYDSATLFAYAFQDDGSPIHVPDTTSVPEPTTLALLAMGAAGLAALRRRQPAA